MAGGFGSWRSVGLDRWRLVGFWVWIGVVCVDRCYMWVWIGAIVAVSCDCGCWWWFLAIFCVSFPLGGCFLWLLLVVSFAVVVVAGRWHGGGKVAIFMWLFLLWLRFGFVHGGERETREEGRERKLERGD